MALKLSQTLGLTEPKPLSLPVNVKPINKYAELQELFESLPGNERYRLWLCFTQPSKFIRQGKCKFCGA